MNKVLNGVLGSAFRGLVLASVAACGSTAVAQVAFDAKGVDQAVDMVQMQDEAALSSLSSFVVEQVAASKGIDAAGLSVAHAAVARFPSQGVTGFAFKLMGPDGSIHSIMIDESGLELDSNTLAAGEKAAQQSQFGKLHPQLAEVLPQLNDGDELPVMIWIQERQFNGTERPLVSDNLSKDELEAVAMTMETERKEFNAATIAPVGQFLFDIGFDAVADSVAPVVYANLDAKTIEAISQLPDVDTVYLLPAGENELAIARQVIRAHTVNARGFTGAGVKVSDIETAGGRLNAGDALIPLITTDNTNSCASGHGTIVSHIIRENPNGIARGCTFRIGGSCSGDGGQLHDASTRAADWGTRVMNLSWGSDTGLIPGGHDRFYDSLVLNRFVTVVKSAGNRASASCTSPPSGDGNVTSPGLAYNVITVGNFNDNGTVSTVGDAMSSCSSWRDPISTHGDREKPEVAAPGSNISTTGGGGSGTSFAAPMVTGGAALLIQRNAGLSLWPEAIRAILMATALQNIEGAARLSEKDGAGGIQLDRADDVARGFGGGFNTRSYNCASPASLDVMTMSLVAGKRTRVVISWDSDPAYGDYNNRPSADLDLQILNSAGSVVASSLSWDNTYEIVDFVPATSGVYRVRVNKFRCDLSPRYLGTAWYRMP